MPEMTGPELIRHLKSTHGDFAVLFVTGYVGGEGETDNLVGYELLRSHSRSVRWPTRCRRPCRGRLAHRAGPQEGGQRLIAASKGHRLCHGLIWICVPAWRLIFHAM